MPPKYRSTPRSTQATISTANAAVDGTGTMTEIMAGTANGTEFDYSAVGARGNTTDGWIRFFRSTDNGTTKRLVPGGEVRVTKRDVLGDRPRWAWVWRPPGGITLKDANDKLYIATENAETFDVFSQGADLTA